MAITTTVRTEQGLKLTELWSLEFDISSCSMLLTNSTIENVGIARFVARTFFLPTDMDTQGRGISPAVSVCHPRQCRGKPYLPCLNYSNTCSISNSFALS